jgi:hypothetical protein
MTARSPAVMVAFHDGFYGWGTGAGRSNSAFLQILAGLLAPGVRLTVIPVRLVPASSGYGDPWHQESLAIVERAGGAVVPVDNGSAGMTRFGGLSHFRRASAAAAAVTEGILSGTARSLVIAFDAPFYGLAPLLPTGQRARLVNVARATAALHAPADRERAEWERAGLLAAASAGGASCRAHPAAGSCCPTGGRSRTRDSMTFSRPGHPQSRPRPVAGRRLDVASVTTAALGEIRPPQNVCRQHPPGQLVLGGGR